jgi:hypothetical protein
VTACLERHFIWCKFLPDQLLRRSETLAIAVALRRNREGDRAMARLCVSVCLLLAAGCMADDAARNQFDAAMRDGRGENMRMRGDMSRLDDSGDIPSLRPRN